MMTTDSRRFRMLHLAVNPTQQHWPKVAVERELDKAKDWIRYAPSCYLFWTNTSAQEWHAHFRATIPELRSHQYLICGVDLTDKQGLLPKEAWEWINRYEVEYRDILANLWTGSQKPDFKRKLSHDEIARKLYPNSANE